MNKIGIRFGDNDFYNTFTGVLKFLKEGYKWSCDLKFTKKQLCNLINNISMSCYIVFQNQYEYDVEHFLHTKEYLHLKEDNIYIDDEVDNYLNDKNTFLNGEFHVLDLTQHTPYIYTT